MKNKLRSLVAFLLAVILFFTAIPVLGFTISVQVDETNDWLEAFVNSLSNGKTIGEAMYDADQIILGEYGSSDNLTTKSEYRYFVGDINYIPFD